MKKVFLVLAVIALVGVTATSCKSEKKEVVKAVYYCPMECEGDKTYEDKDAKCPDCGMNLVLKEAHKDDHQHEGESDH